MTDDALKCIQTGLSPFFRTGLLVQNLRPQIIFLHRELHIISKLRNLEIREHSSFFNYWK